MSQLPGDRGDEVREGCLEEVVLKYTSERNSPRMKCVQCFHNSNTVEIHLPFSRDSLPLQKNQAVLCLPAKDNDKMSFLARLLPQTEALVTGLFGTKEQFESMKPLTSSPSRPSSPISPNSPCQGTRHTGECGNHPGQGTGQVLSIRTKTSWSTFSPGNPREP